ncbi:MAG TPA: spore protease YyaC [Symbiobacteriaceae bacterium]|nr:spore protease YyaC [Symbiobacteriaceae bacterium]
MWGRDAVRIPWNLRAKRIHRIEATVPNAVGRVATAVRSVLQGADLSGRPILVLCIGTDRATGDAFGPLVGSMLEESGLFGCTLLGTLEEPVHATNLAATLCRIRRNQPYPFILAVDACLGRPTSVGSIQVGQGSIQPGAGVQKGLDPVGDAFVLGVVNTAGFWGDALLQQTRLSLVMRLARATAAGIRLGLQLRVSGGRPSPPRQELIR